MDGQEAAINVFAVEVTTQYAILTDSMERLWKLPMKNISRMPAPFMSIHLYVCHAWKDVTHALDPYRA